MSDDRRGEDQFFDGAKPVPEAPPPRRRESARSPILAVLVAALAGWLLVSIWPEVAFFYSSRAPIDLGGPGAYRLDAARENRLVQIRGAAEQPEFAYGKDASRAVGLVGGTDVLVDHPGLKGVGIYEGRLLPQGGRRDEYRAIVEVMRSRGARIGDSWRVVYDGERPRHAWWPIVGSALLVAVLVFNLRVLVRALLLRPQERR
jgi:hypothetical protein